MEHGTYRSRKPMKKHVTITLFSLALSFLGTAQTLIMLKPVKMKKWGVPAANYSGIAHLGGDRYAVVSDKQTNDGYYEFRIVIDGTTGKVKDIKLIDFHKNENKSRDAEGICYANGKIYISAEDDQRIIEYDEKGHRTGRELAVPEGMTKDNIYSNYGFEALTYSDETALFGPVRRIPYVRTATCHRRKSPLPPAFVCSHSTKHCNPKKSIFTQPTLHGLRDSHARWRSACRQ